MDVIMVVAQVVGSLALVVSVVLLYRELHETNRLTRAANAQSLVDLSSSFFLALTQDRRMAELYFRGADDSENLDDVDQSRYKHLMIWWLIFHENIFYQRQQGLLDPHAFKPWQMDLKLFIVKQRLNKYWPEMKELFQDEFADHVRQLIDEIQP